MEYNNNNNFGNLDLNISSSDISFNFSSSLHLSSILSLSGFLENSRDIKKDEEIFMEKFNPLKSTQGILPPQNIETPQPQEITTPKIENS